MQKDVWHMRRALRLAKKAEGWTKPNPMVGAVLVKDGVRIGEGFHANFGCDHAEIEALKNANQNPRGATLYVTLEPCDHTGKTGPCVDTILNAGISRVVMACPDPLRKGAERLTEAGLQVDVGLLEEESRRLNKAFFTYHEQKRPYITLKWAMSLDGKISDGALGQTKITGSSAQKRVHKLRHLHQAILVGAGTLLSDDPHLGCRDIDGLDPLRVVLKGGRPLKQSLQFFRDDHHLVLDGAGSADAVCRKLYEAGVQSVLVEGGQKVLSMFLNESCFDALNVFVAPSLIGEKGLSFAGGLDFDSKLGLKLKGQKKFGSDLELRFEKEFHEP